MSTNVFPKDASTFPLRRDFVDEIGFCDQLRDMAVNKAVAQRRRQELELTDDPEGQFHEWHRSLYSPPQFFCYFSGTEPHLTMRVRYIWDGNSIVPIVEDGAVALWKHMLVRISLLVKGGPEVVASLAAVKAPADREAWGVPPCAIVHDTHAGMAAVLSWARSVEYIKLNPKRD